jgi:hypothetical protein
MRRQQIPPVNRFPGTQPVHPLSAILLTLPDGTGTDSGRFEGKEGWIIGTTKTALG